MTNAYCELGTLKSGGGLNISGSGYDGRLLALLEEASRLIDGYCNRHFYVLNVSRQFETRWRTAGQQQLVVPDLIGVRSVRVASGCHGLEENPPWRSASYRLFPLDAAPEQPWGRPYTRIAVEHVVPRQLGPGDCPTVVEISGRWGYRQVKESTGATLSAVAAPAAGTLTVSDGAGFSAGQTLGVGEEQVYVTAVAEKALSVERKVNGTEAVEHSVGTAIDVYRYPGPVVEACLQLAARLWHSRSGAATVPPVPRQAGEPRPSLGQELEGLLSAYLKLAV